MRIAMLTWESMHSLFAGGVGAQEFEKVNFAKHMIECIERKVKYMTIINNGVFKT